MSTSTFQTRLRRAARDMGISEPQARRPIQEPTGSSRAAMTYWWHGSTREVKGGNAALAAQCLNVNVLWLVSGEGPKRTETVMSIYEEIADLMCSSVAGRDLPRDVVIRYAQKKWPDPEVARALLEEIKRAAEAFAASGLAIVYDPLELAIARQKQRALK